MRETPKKPVFFTDIFYTGNSPQVKASVCQEGESEKLNEKNRCLKWIGDQSNAEERQQKSQNQGYPPSVVGKFPKAERALEDVDRIQQYDNSQNKWENGEDDPRSNEADDTDDKQDDAQYEIGLESGLGFFAVKVRKSRTPPYRSAAMPTKTQKSRVSSDGFTKRTMPSTM